MLALASGSGYLAFDVNVNGRINDGSELFGACSGDDFAEHARLDKDGNHWLDEQDSGFAGLRIWQRSKSGEDLLPPERAQYRCNSPRVSGYTFRDYRSR